MNEQILTVSKAAAIIGVWPGTLRDSPEKYGLTVLRTKGGHRRFGLADVQAAAIRLKIKRHKRLDAVEIA